MNLSFYSYLIAMSVSQNAAETMPTYTFNPCRSFLIYAIESLVDKVVMAMKNTKFYMQEDIPNPMEV